MSNDAKKRGLGRGLAALLADTAGDLPVAPVAATKGSVLARGSDRVEEELREAVILATLISHPGLVHRFESALERLDLVGEGHAALRDLILAHQGAGDLGERIAAQAPAALDALMARPHVQIAPPVRNRAPDYQPPAPG